jgi:hypothetical protein
MADIPVGTDMQERVLGGLFLAIGALATHFFVWSPYLEMQAGAEEVEIKFLRVLFGPVAMALGLMQIVLGLGAAEILGRGDYEASWRTAVALTAIFGAGLLAYFWLDAQATAFGYG